MELRRHRTSRLGGDGTPKTRGSWSFRFESKFSLLLISIVDMAATAAADETVAAAMRSRSLRFPSSLGLFD